MPRETQTISRREMLNRSMALSALAAAQISLPQWMPRLALASPTRGPRGDVLVCIFLRGGADGLNVIVAHGEAAYYAARPALNLARADDSNADKDKKALDLDGFFGLHPALEPILPIFKGGGAVAVHATGSPDPTRSHFAAMDYMARGTPGSHSLNTGWIGRHLASLDTGTNAPVRAIRWGNSLQQSLRGTINAPAIQSIVDYHLAGRKDAAAEMLAALNSLYGADAATLKAVSDQTNAVLDLVSKINVAAYKPTDSVEYDDKNSFDMALMQTAALIKADVGLEVSAIAVGGRDTHQNENADLAADLTGLGKGLAAFHNDMGDAMKNITVVVMSEFGRRVQENARGGTQQGPGNMSLVVGGHVAKKPVTTVWPGLTSDNLVRGDLAIAIDSRDVLTEFLTNRLKNNAVD